MLGVRSHTQGHVSEVTRHHEAGEFLQMGAFCRLQPLNPTKNTLGHA
jgi:hypothetical protein